MKITYKTDRDYGAPQVLEIIAPDVATSDLQLVVVYFCDSVRDIAGIVEILDIYATPDRIGRAVLSEYDAGNYKPV